MTLAPYTPSAANVLRSAWIPAPPLESDPAIVRAMGVMAKSSRARLVHRLGILRSDPRDAAGGKIADALAEYRDDAREPLGPDRPAYVLLRGRAVHAADADIVEDAERRRARLLHRLDRQADERHRP